MKKQTKSTYIVCESFWCSMKMHYQHKTYEHVRKEFRFEISRIYERGFFSTKLMPMMMSISKCQLQCRISIADVLLIKLMSDCDTFFVIFRLLCLLKCKKKLSHSSWYEWMMYFYIKLQVHRKKILPSYSDSFLFIFQVTSKAHRSWRWGRPSKPSIHRPASFSSSGTWSWLLWKSGDKCKSISKKMFKGKISHMHLGAFCYRLID